VPSKVANLRQETVVLPVDYRTTLFKIDVQDDFDNVAAAAGVVQQQWPFPTE
jgi:hypothetical protein